MKKQSLWVFIGLNLITLGFYSVYWLYITRKEMVAAGAHVPSFGWLVWPWVAMFAAVFLGAFVPQGENILMILALVLYLAVFGIYMWWFWPYSKAVEQVTGNQLEAIAAYVLIIFLGSIGFVVIQYFFNKIPEGEAVGLLPTS
jgi:hypothetical protein